MVDPGSETGLLQWTVSDATGANLFTFNIGPSEGGEPQEERNFVFQNELGADSSVSVSVAYEAAAKAPSLQLQGTALNLDQVAALRELASRNVPLLLTDDLAREFQVYPVSLEATRKPKPSHPERHDWTLKFVVLDGLIDGSAWTAYV